MQINNTWEQIRTASDDTLDISRKIWPYAVHGHRSESNPEPLQHFDWAFVHGPQVSHQTEPKWDFFFWSFSRIKLPPGAKSAMGSEIGKLVADKI